MERSEESVPLMEENQIGSGYFCTFCRLEIPSGTEIKVDDKWYHQSCIKFVPSVPKKCNSVLELHNYTDNVVKVYCQLPENHSSNHFHQGNIDDKHKYNINWR